MFTREQIIYCNALFSRRITLFIDQTLFQGNTSASPRKAKDYSLVPKERHVRKEGNGSTLWLSNGPKESHDSTVVKKTVPKESHDCSFSLT